MKQLIFLIFFSIFTFSVGANEIDDLTKLADDGDPIAQNNLMSLEKINISKRNYFDDQRNYYVVGLADNLNSYDVLDLYLKTGDKKYIIRTIGGVLDLNGPKCFSKKDEIAIELENFFPNIVKEEFEKSHEFDKSNKSKLYQTVFS